MQAGADEDACKQDRGEIGAGPDAIEREEEDGIGVDKPGLFQLLLQQIAFYRWTASMGDKADKTFNLPKLSPVALAAYYAPREGASSADLSLTLLQEACK